MSNGTNAATGRTVAFALGSERSFGVPRGLLTSFDPILPVNADLPSPENASPQINRSGFVRKGTPGSRTGAAEWSHPMTSAHLLEFFHHMIGRVVKDEPEAGVYRYVFEPEGLDASTSFWGFIGKEPVSREHFYGLMFGSMELTIGANELIPVKLSGNVGHGTPFSTVTPAPANIGSYTLGPYLRGPLNREFEPLGDYVHFEITRDIAGGGVRFRVFHGGGTPAFLGTEPEFDVMYDEDGNAIFQNVQNQTGLDLGYWAENKDPLEVIFPGTATDHADLSIGDVFSFQLNWTLPNLGMIADAQSFTSAHWVMQVRPAGSSDAFRNLKVTSGSLMISSPLEPQIGNGSRYPFRQFRPGPFTTKLTFKRPYADSFLKDLLRAHERLEISTAFEGKQIGTGAFREGFSFSLPSAGIVKGDSPVGGEGIVEEDVELNAETDASGSAPIILTVISERDWTPPV